MAVHHVDAWGASGSAFLKDCAKSADCRIKGDDGFMKLSLKVMAIGLAGIAASLMLLRGEAMEVGVFRYMYGNDTVKRLYPEGHTRTAIRPK